jgi:hypothetical protein
VRKLIALGTAALASAGASMVLLSAGVASADDSVVGKTYADATTTLTDEGKTGKVATTVGDKQDRDNCVVTSANNSPFVGGTDGTHVSDTVLLNLNCYATAASGGPGYSAADQAPDAQAVRSAAAEAGSESEAGVTAANQH